MPYGVAARNHDARHVVFLRLADLGLPDDLAREVAKRLPGYVAKAFCTEFDDARGVRPYPDFVEGDTVTYWWDGGIDEDVDALDKRTAL